MRVKILLGMRDVWGLAHDGEGGVSTPYNDVGIIARGESVVCGMVDGARCVRTAKRKSACGLGAVVHRMRGAHVRRVR